MIMKRTRKVKEADIQKMIVDVLEPLVAQNKIRYIRHHPIRLATRKGKTFFVPVNPSQLGAADLIVFLPSEVWIIETKAPKGKLKEHQITWGSWFPALASLKVYSYLVPKTVKEASELIDRLMFKIR